MDLDGSRLCGLCSVQESLVAFPNHYQNSSLSDNFGAPSFGLTAEAAVLFFPWVPDFFLALLRYREGCFWCGISWDLPHCYPQPAPRKDAIWACYLWKGMVFERLIRGNLAVSACLLFSLWDWGITSVFCPYSHFGDRKQAGWAATEKGANPMDVGCWCISPVERCCWECPASGEYGSDTLRVALSCLPWTL